MKRNQWQGRDVLVLGSGPSLNDFNVDYLKRFPTIGINQIARRLHPDIVTLLDSPMHMGEGMRYALDSLITSEILVSAYHMPDWQAYRDMDSVRDRKLPLMHGIEFKPHHDWKKWNPEAYRSEVNAWPDEGPPTDLPFGYTSLSTAVWLAVFLGAKRVGIIGMDHGERYFFDSVKPHAMNGDNTLEHAQHHYEQLSAFVHQLTGVEIYNLSRRSLIDAIPMADFDKWVGETL